jgi:hypothetical protein
VYAFSGADGEVLTRIEQPEPDTSAFFGFQDVDRFAPGDLNGDGVPEIYALGWLQDGPNGEQSAGRPWVFDGAKSVAAGEGVLLYEIENPDLAPSKTFGWSMSKTDYNKDGTPDLYIGTSSAADDPMYVFDGRDGSLLKKLSLPSPELQARQPGNLGTGLGWSSRAPGDLNGDCEPDYVAGAPFQDVGGAEDQGKVFFFLSSGPSACPPPPPPPPGPGPGLPGGFSESPCGIPGSAGYLNPAKIRVSRATVDSDDEQLDLLAPITSRARGGDVGVTFSADDRIDIFDTTVTDADTELDEIRLVQDITEGQADLGTGILVIDYLGNASTRREVVRLRAAERPAELDVDEISLVGDRLSAEGSVTGRAEGIVRFNFSYPNTIGVPQVHEARAEITDDGSWELDGDQVPAQLAQCGGYLSIQFTGFFERRIRGEQLAYELGAGQTRRP